MKSNYAILIFFVFLAFLLNLSAPSDLSYASAPLLFADFLGVLIFARIILNRKLQEFPVFFRNNVYKCFLVLLFLSMVYLYFCWTPYLSLEDPNDGFDPARYYYYSKSLILGTNEPFALNYIGIIYFFQMLMTVFGIDPLVPLFFNSLLVLLSFVNILSVFRESKCSFTNKFIYILLLPEIVFYVSLSSREIICMSLCTIIACRLILFLKDNKKSHIWLILFLNIALMLIRPPFAIVTMLCILFIMAWRSKHRLLYAFGGIVLFTCLFLISNVLSSEMGSLNDIKSIQESIVSQAGGSAEISDSFSYGNNSLTKKLIPSNIFEFLIFGGIRSILYLIPKINPIAFFQISSSYNVGDIYLVNFTSFFFFLTIPSILWTILNFKKIELHHQIFFIFLISFISLVGFFNTTLIQDRYRVVYDLLLCCNFICVLQEIGVRSYKMQILLLFKYCLLLSPFLIIFLFA